MRLILALMLALLLTNLAVADGPPLTAAEAAEGWLALFDGETTFGWQGKRDAGMPSEEFRAEKGALVIGSKAFRQDVACTTLFGNFDLSFEYKCEEIPDGFPGGVKAWFIQRRNGLEGKVELLPLANGGWRKLEVHQEADAKRQAVDVHYDYIDPTEQRTVKENFPGTPTPVQVEWSVPRGVQLRLRNVKLRPQGLTSLFNGKDLDGWRVFPGEKYKSKFSVTPQGELNVKDGPGDLQTVGKYGDFILQLDCISNGMHLNSGIFFRCRDGEYQNGYEAQIRNQFTREPSQEYLIEEYYPASHELKGKKKLNSTAVDFGTGAIYRRICARKEASKDGEWFTLTVVARGNHFATWVNGVQQVDWLDHRPRSDNARLGCCLNAGHLSIQGHDPTTDLSFRNLRIAELPKGK